MPVSAPSVGVRYVDIPAQFRARRAEILADVEAVLESGAYVLGPAVEAFERRFAALCGVRHAVGVANGTDAIALVLRALGIGHGDEVITVAHSFIATAGAIVEVGARPVFVDVDSHMTMDPSKIDPAITPRTKAILPVHLTGRCAEMEPILEIARRRNLAVIEDAAQAVGAERGGRRAGSFGLAAAFSLHPLKNLNACGDAGVIATDDAGLAERLRALRNHGLVSRDEARTWGRNSRLDTLQAAILLRRLDDLEATIERRRAIAARYRARLGHLVECPEERPGERHTYHLFVIRCDGRDALQAHLARCGIETKIHYPVPIHLQPAAAGLGYAPGDLPVTERDCARILSLPVHQHLSDAEVDAVCDAIEKFFGG